MREALAALWTTLVRLFTVVDKTTALVEKVVDEAHAEVDGYRAESALRRTKDLAALKKAA